MTTEWIRAAAVFAAFAVVFATGYLLTRFGRPYGTALLTVHKLVAVGTLGYLGVTAYQASQASALGASLLLVVVLVTVVFVATIASGGVLSASESPPAGALLLHKVAPYVTAVLTALALYRLLHLSWG